MPELKPAAADMRPLSHVHAIYWLALFSVREMSRRRRLLSLALINLLPVLVVLAVRVWMSGQGLTAQVQLTSLTFKVFVPFLIPVAAMAVGIPAIGEQVEDGTLIFTWTRPLSRWAIYLGRLLAAQTVAVVLMSGALVLCFLVMVSGGWSVVTWDFLKLYLQTFLIITCGAVTYTAVFAAVGTFFRKPVLPALLFAFGWENMVSNIPARVQELTLRFHLQNLIERPDPVTQLGPSGLLNALMHQVAPREPVPGMQSVAVLFLVTVVATLLGVWLLRRKELVN